MQNSLLGKLETCVKYYLFKSDRKKEKKKKRESEKGIIRNEKSKKRRWAKTGEKKSGEGGGGDLMASDAILFGFWLNAFKIFPPKELYLTLNNTKKTEKIRSGTYFLTFFFLISFFRLFLTEEKV